jgi:excisionase family DNA binding protein
MSARGVGAVAEQPNLMSPAEVAQVFRVTVKTVTRWADAGKLVTVRTPGGHRRFQRAEIDALLAAAQETAP